MNNHDRVSDIAVATYFYGLAFLFIALAMASHVLFVVPAAVFLLLGIWQLVRSFINSPPRFSLRFLLILMTLVALMLGLLVTISRLP